MIGFRTAVTSLAAAVGLHALVAGIGPFEALAGVLAPAFWLAGLFFGAFAFAELAWIFLVFALVAWAFNYFQGRAGGTGAGVLTALVLLVLSL